MTTYDPPQAAQKRTRFRTTGGYDGLICTDAVRKPTSKKSLPLDGPCQPYSGGTRIKLDEAASIRIIEAVRGTVVLRTKAGGVYRPQGW
ncbi:MULTISPECIES: hypothetical protein [Streptosporangium]|uniref:Uncharacterized protein n=1 Tax=Streptosporangium brasiliense TaxID=47480 RepID=A0ABT9RJC3_9ACTN|nr:hypothetical protein [Streptosporangium brasiliense]MDP9869401.1 hypothetical protein [Streptosporangium brasiliense]